MSYRKFALAGIAALLLGAAAPGASAQTADGTVVVALVNEPDFLDPMATRNIPAARATLHNIVEPLVGVAPDGSVAPGVATWTVSPDGRSITFKLNPKAKFHTGDRVTSKDIVFGHERSVKVNPLYPARMASLDRLEIVDDQTVTFHFKQPDATFLQYRIFYVESKDYFDRVGEAQFMAHPIGTGPYKFVSRKQGESIDMEAFEDYWGGAPPIKKVRIRFIKDDVTRVAVLRAGEVDAIMGTPFTQVTTLAGQGLKNIVVPAHPSV